MMIEIILGCVVLVALLGIIIIIYHNKFRISIVKMEEAEKALDNAQVSLEEAGKYDEIIRHYIEGKREVFK